MDFLTKIKLFLKYKFSLPGAFEFNNEKYIYYWNMYNATINNERAVEVPIVNRFIGNDLHDKHILEIGNVLPHYCILPKNYDIVDKYEKAEFVKNIDILDYFPEKSYDVIVSISTLEHVGKDENPVDMKKAGNAIKHIKTLLKKGGQFICTIPVGYNTELDKEFKKYFDNVYFMKKISKDNIWEQCSKEDALKAKYDIPYPAANAIMIGVYKK